VGERDEDGAGVGHHVLPDLVDACEVPQHPAREHSPAVVQALRSAMTPPCTAMAHALS
jgi:hypothetical protein